MLDCVPHSPKQFLLFESLSAKVEKCLCASGRERHYARGEVICLQDEPAKSLKVVISGWVKLYRVTENGGEAILAALEHGHSFDEVDALLGGDSKLSAEAMTDCTILHLDLNAIGLCKDAHSEISSAVLTAANSKISELITQLESLKVKTALQRLCEYLLNSITCNSEQVALELPYGKNVLAGHLGMQPESLSRAFKRLKSLGIESCGRNVRIGDVPALRCFAEQKSGCA